MGGLCAKAEPRCLNAYFSCQAATISAQLGDLVLHLSHALAALKPNSAEH